MNALSLMAPAGLFALAALAIPLLIHLFSRSRGKRVLVGNIALYRQAQRQRVTQVRVVQWLLLFLRLVLLALAALLLAGLMRKGLETLPGNTAYVTAQWLEATTDPAAELAAFDAAFVLAPDARGLPGVDANGVSDPWSLLAERLASVRHTGDVHVFARGVAGQFPREAPAPGATLTWHLDPSPVDPVPPARVQVQVVHAPGRERDAAEVVAALEALSDQRRVPLTIGRSTTDQPVPRPDSGRERRALIWLGDEPAPETLLEEWGPGVWLEDRRPVADAPPAEARLPRFPQLEFPTRVGGSGGTVREEETVLWSTARGRPLLRETRLGAVRRLVFEDRLGADGLTAQAAFPEILLRLLLGERAWNAGLAHAPVDPTAAMGRTRPAQDGPGRPLAPWLALAIALLFVLERWLSERRPGAPEAPTTP